jgi:hypothetical protein
MDLIWANREGIYFCGNGWTGSIRLIGFEKFADWRKGTGAQQVRNVSLSADSDATGNIEWDSERARQQTFCDALHYVPRKGSELGADVPEAAYVGLPLLREFERRRHMTDEYAGCHRCLDVLRLARCQLERNRIFDLGCRCYGVFPRGAIDIREPAGDRSADDFIVHLNLGLNSRPRKIARPGEVDTAVTRLQCRDLQGRFIKATWTRAARQQKSDKQKGLRPDFRPHYAPSRYSKSPSYIEGK